MKYFAALPLVASLAAATEMTVMSLAPAAAEGAATHTVQVGGLKPVETGMAPVLGYSPESITAKVGDTVKFVFMQKNHTVTQSTFDKPCNKMEGGMDSGFMPNPMGEAGVEWEMQVPSEEPLWFYCKQKNGTHCAKGMVFAINAKTDGEKTFAQYKQLAIKNNGTDAPLEPAAIQSVDPAAQAAPTTVTIAAGGGGGEGMGSMTATSTAVAAVGTASVVAGEGTDQAGNACTCHCLCGVNDFPQAAAQSAFGGFGGMIAPGL